MKTLKRECPWFESLMEAIIIDRRSTKSKSTIYDNYHHMKLSLLEQVYGYYLGNSFNQCLARVTSISFSGR